MIHARRPTPVDRIGQDLDGGGTRPCDGSTVAQGTGLWGVLGASAVIARLIAERDRGFTGAGEEIARGEVDA